MATIELHRPINRHSVESTFRWIKRIAPKGTQCSEVRQAMRAVKARDPRLMLVLDKGAEVLDSLVDDQYGRTRRDIAATVGETAYPTEAGMWRNAYEEADKGRCDEVYCWVYAGAAHLAGILV